jgi:hypothetical protein
LLAVTAFKLSGASALIKGHVGEWLVRKCLENALPAEDYRCLHDVTLPGPSGSTQIDHVVVSRYGIFVIETKHMSGWIFGSARDAQWTQTFHRRKLRFQNPLRQNFAHVKALAALLGLDDAHFHSVVVFTGTAEFKTPMPSEVAGLGGLASSIRSVCTPLIADARLPGLVATIEAVRLAPGRETRAAHVASLRSRHGEELTALGVLGQLWSRAGLVLAATKALVSLAAIAAFYLIATQVLDGLKDSLAGAAAPGVSRPAASPDGAVLESAPKLFSGTNAALEQARANADAQAQALQQQKRTRWEASLLCAYSVDSGRCACYEPKGPKADIPQEQCIELANKGSILTQ